MKKFCSKCGNELESCSCNNNENKIKRVFNGIGYAIILFLSYVFIPSFIALFVQYIFHFNETLCSFIGNFIYIIAVVIYYRDLFINGIKDYFKKFTSNLGTSFKYWGIGLGIMIVTNLLLNYFVFPGQIANNEEVNRQFLEMNKIIGFIQIVFMAPVIEELIFRYSIRKITNDKVWYPLLSGLVFGLPHALTGITTPLELLYTIPYGALGWAFASLYNKTDNIITNISMHMLHNFIVYMIIILVL